MAERSVLVQQRAERPLKVGCLAPRRLPGPRKCRLSKLPEVPTSREHQEHPLEGSGQMVGILGRPGLGETGQPNFVTPRVHHLRGSYTADLLA